MYTHVEVGLRRAGRAPLFDLFGRAWASNAVGMSMSDGSYSRTVRRARHARIGFASSAWHMTRSKIQGVSTPAKVFATAFCLSPSRRLPARRRPRLLPTAATPGTCPPRRCTSETCRRRWAHGKDTARECLERKLPRSVASLPPQTRSAGCNRLGERSFLALNSRFSSTPTMHSSNPDATASTPTQHPLSA